ERRCSGRPPHDPGEDQAGTAWRAIEDRRLQKDWLAFVGADAYDGELTAGVQGVGGRAREQPVVQDLVRPLSLVAVDLDVDGVHIVQGVDHIPAVAGAHAGSTALLLSMRMCEAASCLPSSLCAASSPNRGSSNTWRTTSVSIVSWPSARRKRRSSIPQQMACALTFTRCLRSASYSCSRTLMAARQTTSVRCIPSTSATASAVAAAAPVGRC